MVTPTEWIQAAGPVLGALILAWQFRAGGALRTAQELQALESAIDTASSRDDPDQHLLRAHLYRRMSDGHLPDRMPALIIVLLYGAALLISLVAALIDPSTVWTPNRAQFLFMMGLIGVAMVAASLARLLSIKHWDLTRLHWRLVHAADEEYAAFLRETSSVPEPAHPQTRWARFLAWLETWVRRRERPRAAPQSVPGHPLEAADSRPVAAAPDDDHE